MPLLTKDPASGQYIAKPQGSPIAAGDLISLESAIVIYDGVSRPELMEARNGKPQSYKYNLKIAIPQNSPDHLLIEAVSQQELQTGDFRGVFPAGARWSNTPVAPGEFNDQLQGYVVLNPSTYTAPQAYDSNGQKVPDMSLGGLLFQGQRVDVLLSGVSTYNNQSKGIKPWLDGVRIRTADQAQPMSLGGNSVGQAANVYGQPPAQQPPAQQYGQQPPAQQYGQPPAQQPPAQQYGQPPAQQPPAQQYGQPPAQQPPAQQYGQPPAQQPPAQQYGQPPAQQPPAQQYGQPPAQQPPAQQYGQPPAQQPPAQQYGQPPAQQPPAQQYGQPPAQQPPAQQYGQPPAQQGGYQPPPQQATGYLPHQ